MGASGRQSEQRAEPGRAVRATSELTFGLDAASLVELEVPVTQ